MSLEDEQRAALWRSNMRARVAFQRGLFAALAGDRASLFSLRARWQPLVDWLAERDMPDLPADEDPVWDPLALSDQTNV